MNRQNRPGVFHGSRRTLLRRTALLGLAASASGGIVGAVRAQAIVNVRDEPYGAKGDGMTNDTQAFKDAIDAMRSMPAGSILTVPKGVYLLNPNPQYCVKPISDMKLELQPGAKLKALPSTLERHYVLWLDAVDNVEIYGLGSGDEIAEIIGERYQHRGTTGEWGQGIRAAGASHVTIMNVRISDFWGDGITIVRKSGVNCQHVTISNVICTNNRRQGMSLTGVDHIEVVDSEFSHTNGTAPQDGLDVEPDPGGRVSDVLIRRCRFNDNKGNGLEFNALAGEEFVVTGVEVRNNDIEFNEGFGVYANHLSGCWLVQNRIKQNGLAGTRVAPKCRDHAYGQNAYTNNSTRYIEPDPSPECRDVTGLNPTITGRHFEKAEGTILISVNTNTYCH